MSGVREALEAERKVEHEFVEKASRAEHAPRGWPAALVLFHVGMWRERMRNMLTELSEDRTPTPPPVNQDELNDAELAEGIGTPLSDAAARADYLLTEIADLYDKVGDRPVTWYRSKTTSEAVLGNSYTHPRLHVYRYLRENDEDETANLLWETAVTDLRAASATPLHMGAALFNLAGTRVAQDRKDEALTLLEEAFSLRPDLKSLSKEDAELAPLRDEPAFKALLGG